MLTRHCPHPCSPRLLAPPPLTTHVEQHLGVVLQPAAPQPGQQHAVLQEYEVWPSWRRHRFAHRVQSVVGGGHPDGPLPWPASQASKRSRGLQMTKTICGVKCLTLHARGVAIACMRLHAPACGCMRRECGGMRHPVGALPCSQAAPVPACPAPAASSQTCCLWPVPPALAQ